MIFSVEDLSILDVFDWMMFVVLYGAAAALIAFPALSRIWPFTSFTLLKRHMRGNGVAILVLVSIIAVPHFLMTALPLREQKTALLAGSYEALEAVYDGPQPNKTLAFATIPATSLSFSGKSYDVPGSLHGSLKLLPKIRTKLQTKTTYRLFLWNGVILKIEAV